MAVSEEDIKKLETTFSGYKLGNYKNGVVFTSNVEDLACGSEEMDPEDEDSEGENVNMFTGESDPTSKRFNLFELPPSDLDQLTVNSINVTADGGVMKLIKNPGNGCKPPIGSKVGYEYVGYILGYDHGHFDSSHGKEIWSKLDEDSGLIGGLLLSLQSMEIGEEAQFVVHHKYGYGQMGCPPRVPKEARLIFNIRLTRYLSCQDLQNPIQQSRKQRKMLPFTEILNSAHGARSQGNQLATKEDYAKAKRWYKLAIECLETYSNVTEEENSQRDGELVKCYSNVAFCYLKLEKAPQACSACKNGLRYKNDQLQWKLFYRFAEAKFKLQGYDEALNLIEKARRAGAPESAVVALKEKVLQGKRDSSDRERTMCQLMFNT